MANMLRTVLLGLFFFTTAQAQFQFFEQMFGGSGQQHQESHGQGGNVPSDSAWYQNTYNGAHCSNYLCPGTLACVAVPHHCPCAHPQVEDKFELGEGSAICASKGGFKAEGQDDISSTIRGTDPRNNSLLAPVHIPEDPDGLLKENHPASQILVNSGLVVQRQLEMMNVLLGFEQANRYVILDAQGNHIGYMAEEEKGMGSMLSRQWLHTHRPFVTHVFDKNQNEVLRFHRPFSWINSTIFVFDPHNNTAGSHAPLIDLQQNTSGLQEGSVKVSPLVHSQMRVIGAAQQRWAPLRRKYNLFLSHPHASVTPSHIEPQQPAVPPEKSLRQFAHVDEPFLSWDFSVRSAESHLLGSVNRNFAGFAREIFTDTGVYALRMDSAGMAEDMQSTGTSTLQSTPAPSMTLDQRAVMLATAVTIDFDYFSRHSGGPGIMPIPLFGLGGGGTGAAAAGGGAGAMEGAAAGAVGAGTLAGYEAMHRGSSTAHEPAQQTQHVEGQQEQQYGNVEQGTNEEVWGEADQYPWDQRDGGPSSGNQQDAWPGDGGDSWGDGGDDDFF
ncbi:phospholipid scramblase family protein [Arthroderma uncinatum]|uniref:phospholipid scramblase family protein n=1 Tax=Arthroderma uncinatum TaxID=74035 RepID=UPI00144ACAC7|nr:phospholipid scramblase family protein [Arthroderma uncinatum]KAF3479774.1 phospholipid scramblase family protein [Arthroderma uncinatum]